jgi:ribose-phosphate pyrophosphokinase
MTAVLRIVSGTANPGLASAVANHLSVESDGCNLARYPDGELRPTIENVCGADVYCSCCSTPAAARAPRG